MKKIFAIFLMAATLFALTALVFPKADASEAAELKDEVSNIFTLYNNGGTYKKETTIYVDSTNEELLKDIEYVFHGAKLPELERTTYYSEGRLWMEEPNSGYKTNGSNMQHFSVVNGNDVVDYTVKGYTLDQYYISLNDFVNNDAKAKEFNLNETVALLDSWSKDENGVYYTKDENVLTAFRLFTAP